MAIYLLDHLYILLCRIVNDENSKSNVLREVWTNLRCYMETYSEKGSEQATYHARNKVEVDLFKWIIWNDMKTLNCEAKVLTIIEDVYAKTFSSVIIKLLCTCRSQEHMTLFTLSIDVNKDLKGFDYSSGMCKKGWKPLQPMDIDFVNTSDKLFTIGRVPSAISLQDEIGTFHSIIQTINPSESHNHYTVHTSH